MKSLPKLVRSRLSSQQVPDAEHPAVDQLAAFSEGWSSSREKAAVLRHLARCLECREIVALTTPAVGCLGLAVIPNPQFLPAASKPVLPSKIT